MLTADSKKSYVVVEIGNEWLKVAESRHAARGRCITKVKYVRLAEIKGPLEEAISKIFKEMKLEKHSIITFIPRHLTNVRILELPSTDPKEINDMVNLQLGKQTPYSKEEIVSAHDIIDTGREGYIKVMLVIARRNIVSERVETLEKSGLAVEKVALSSEGVLDWFSIGYESAIKQYYSQAFAIIDIDSNYSDFMVIRKEKMVFSRNIFIGANNLTEDKSQWQDKLVEELGRSLERYRNEEKGTKIVRIFLAGAARNIGGLDAFLGSKLDIPAETTDPVRNIRIKKNIGILPDETCKLISSSALYGMALAGGVPDLDLTPPEAKIHRMMEEKRKSLTVMGAMFALIAMVLSSILLTDIYNKSIYLNKLKKNISKIEKTADEVRRMRMRIDLVEKRLDARGTSVNVLNEIYKLTPKEIYYNNVVLEEKKQAVLKGRANAMSDVFRFVTTLENSPYFKNAKTTYTTTKMEEGVEYADFEIICMGEK